MDAEVRLVEPLGAELYVHAVLEDAPILARTETPPVPPEPGRRHRFSVRPDRVHLFDGDGLRVRVGS